MIIAENHRGYVSNELSSVFMDLFPHFRSQLRSLSSYDLHKKLINHYVLQSKRFANFKRDIDVIRENHKFLWDDEEPRSWEEQLAKKYYDRLYKEYCIADLSRYKEGKVALRWQIEAELVTGKGQFVCGHKKCNEKEDLKTWEVNFGYVEQGEKKNALVKLRLCANCSDKLNYKHRRREIKRSKKRKHRDADPLDDGTTSPTQSDALTSEELSEEVKQEEVSTLEEIERETSPCEANANAAAEEDSNIWKTANRVVEEKSRDADFEEFLEQLLL